MLTSSATTLDGATRTIRQYKLDQTVWRNGGSPIGFSRWLFLAGGELTASQIAFHMSTYEVACAEASVDGKALDDILRIEAEAHQGALEEVALARQRLSTLIRNTRLAPLGGCLWVAVARLATTLRPALDLVEIGRQGLLPELAALLQAILAMASDFPDCSQSKYMPCDDLNMDYLLRLDIERLDQTLLEVPVWLAAEPEVWTEISALLRLASDRSLSAAIGAKPSPRRILKSQPYPAATRKPGRRARQTIV